VDMLNVDVEWWSANVDWVTATRDAKLDAAGAAKFTDGVFAYLRSFYGNKEARPWAFMDFSGYQLGSACWGNSRERSIVRCYGDAANMAWRQCAAHGSRISRLDIAVTFFPENRGDDLAELCADVVFQNRQNGFIRSDKKISLINGFGSGDTLYLGSRKSQVFARLYDKAAQSCGREKRGTWRAELELKDEKALATARKLLHASSAEAMIAGMVGAHFGQHGVNLRFGSEYATELPHIYKEKDERIEKMMSWLEECVRPTCAKAVVALGADAVIAVLGLTGCESPLTKEIK